MTSKVEVMLDRFIDRMSFKGLELPDATPKGRHCREQKEFDAMIIGGSLWGTGVVLSAFFAPVLLVVLAMNPPKGLRK